MVLESESTVETKIYKSGIKLIDRNVIRNIAIPYALLVGAIYFLTGSKDRFLLTMVFSFFYLIGALIYIVIGYRLALNWELKRIKKESTTPSSDTTVVDTPFAAFILGRQGKKIRYITSEDNYEENLSSTAVKAGVFNLPWWEEKRKMGKIRFLIWQGTYKYILLLGLLITIFDYFESGRFAFLIILIIGIGLQTYSAARIWNAYEKRYLDNQPLGSA